MLYSNEVSKEFIYEVVEAVADDIMNGVVGYDNVDDTIVIVGDSGTAVEFICEQVDAHGDEDSEGYAYYSYTYTAVQGDELLFDVDVFVYNNGDVVVHNCEYDEFQVVVKEVV